MSEPRNVAIRIERVVVDAPDARASDAPRIQAAMEAELVRLFSGRDIVVEGRLERSVSTSGKNLSQQSTAAGVGKQIARAVHEAVTGAR